MDGHAALLNIDTLHWKLSRAIGDLEGLQVAFDAAWQQERLPRGLLHLDTFVEVLHTYDTDLDEDEVLALVQHWDKNDNGNTFSLIYLMSHIFTDTFLKYSRGHTHTHTHTYTHAHTHALKPVYF